MTQAHDGPPAARADVARGRGPVADEGAEKEAGHAGAEHDEADHGPTIASANGSASSSAPSIDKSCSRRDG